MMIKALIWMGMVVGIPSVATWLTSAYLSFADQFLVFFFFSVCALLIGILPRLAEPPRS
jgi:hypothetical protein